MRIVSRHDLTELKDPKQLRELKVAHPKQPHNILNAYLKAKQVLENRQLPVVSVIPAPRKRIDMTLASHALNDGLLDNLSGKETLVYRTLLRGMPFQYRMREVIAEMAGVSISTVRLAMKKLEAIGLIARHRVPNGSCVLAFTDTRELKDDEISRLKAECNYQLIEKSGRRPVIKSELLTGTLSSVQSKKSPKREEECPASPVLPSSSWGEGAAYPTAPSSKSGSRNQIHHDDNELSSHREEDEFGTDFDQEIIADQDQDQDEHESTSDHYPHASTTSTSNTKYPVDVNQHNDHPNNSMLDQMVKQLSLSKGRSYEPIPPQEIEKTNQFDIQSQYQMKQAIRCGSEDVMNLQSAIEDDLKKGVKGMDICNKFYKNHFLLGDLCAQVRRDYRINSQGLIEVDKQLKVHMKSFKMRGQLAQLAVLREDQPAQIEAWIAYAKKTANSPSNYGGLLGTIMLKAQRIDTAILYPEAAQGLGMFLDQLGIGVDELLHVNTEEMEEMDEMDESEATQSSTDSRNKQEADEFEEQCHAGKNARRAILRDYCSVVHAMVEQQREFDEDVKVDDIPAMLFACYNEGDANGSPMRDDAPGPVKFSMLKLALNREVDVLSPKYKLKVYLPHQVHEARRLEKKALEAAAA